MPRHNVAVNFMHNRQLAAVAAQGLVFALLLVGVGLPSKAYPQAGIPYVEPAKPTRPPAQPTAAPTDKPEDAKIDAEPVPPAPPPVVVSSAVTVRRYWEQRRAAIKTGNAIEADRLLSELLTTKEQAGWPNVFAYGDALARDTDRALRKGQPQRAVELADWAVRMSPDLPSVHLARARAQWAQGNYLSSAGAYAHAYGLAYLERPYLEARIVVAFTLLLGALAWVLLVFMIVITYRHLRALLHDVHHLLPRGAARWQAAVFGLLVLLVPVFLRLGPLPTAALWLVGFGLYLEWRERLSAALALACLAGVALALPLVLALLAYPGSRAEAAYFAVRDMQAEAQASRLETSSDPKGEELYILGLRARWAGDATKAVELLSRAEHQGINEAGLFTQLGNLKYGMGDRQGAIAYYNRALDRDPENIVALFNLSRVYYSLAEQTKGGEAHRRATALDYELVETYARDAKRIGPTYVVNPSVPALLLGHPWPVDGWHDRAAEQVWSLLASPNLSRLHFLAGDLAGLLLLVVFTILRRSITPSVACPRCGAPACRRCCPEMPNQEECGQCFHVFIKKDGIDPQARIQKEIDVHRYEARTLRIRQVLSILAIGAAQMLRGATLKGLGFVGLFALAMMALLVAVDIVPSPLPTMPAQLVWPGMIVSGLCALGAYAWSLLDAQRKEH